MGFEQAYVDLWNGKPWAMIPFIRELEQVPVRERLRTLNGANLDLIVALSKENEKPASSKFFVPPDIEHIVRSVAGDQFDQKYTTDPEAENDVIKRLRLFFDGLRESLIENGFIP